MLDAPATGSLLDALVAAVDTARDRLLPLDEAVRALHLGLAVVQTSNTSGHAIVPRDLAARSHVVSV